MTKGKSRTRTLRRDACIARKKARKKENAYRKSDYDKPVAEG